MFIILNLADGTYVEVNDSFVKNTGYSREELIGHSVDELNLWVHQEELDKAKRLLAEQGKLTSEEFSLRMKSGELRLWLCSAEIVNFNSTDRIIAVATDITENKRAEEALRHSEENYRSIIELAPDGIITVDTRGIVTSCNTSFTELTGFTKAEIVSKHFSKLPCVNLKDIPIYFGLFISLMKGQKITITEMPWKHKDGALRLCEFHTGLIKRGKKITGIQAIMRDVTERNQDEERHQTILNTTLDGFWTVDLKGKFLEVNNSYCNMIGYTREELQNMSIMDIEAIDSSEDILKHINKIVKEGGDRFETKHRRKDGRIIDVEVSTNYLDMGGGQMSVFVRDITERKRIEEEIREAELKYRVVADSTYNWEMWISPAGEFIYTSPSCRRITGYNASEFRDNAQLLPNIIHPADLHVWENHLSEISQHKLQVAIEFRILHKDGSEHWIEHVCQPVFDDTGKFQGERGSNRDITERKRGEEALRESEERFSKAFRSSPDRVVISTTKEGIVIDVNDSYLRYTGQTREEVIGHTIAELGSWPNPENRAKIIQKLKKYGRVDNEEVELRSKSGEIRNSIFSADLININGEQCMISIATDITERKRAEEALRESEAQLKCILKAAPIGIALVQGRVALWVNDYYCTMTGYSAQELVGKNSRKLYTSYEEFLRVGELKVQNIESHGKVEVETQFVCKNGKIIDVLLVCTPLNPEEPSAGEITTMMDITERKKVEEQERETKYLRELDKLRTELLANVSHELRTPLASIKGFTTVLTDYDKKLTPAEKREYLEIIDHNTDRLSELIEQLLVMSRLGAGMLTIDREPGDITSVCREVISEAKVRTPEFNFVLNMPKRLPRAFIDPKRIRQVLNNLIDNAVKHSFPDTEISISAHRSNDEILVTVTDEGTGISRKDKPYVFDRMFHTRRKRKPGATGVGLGLSICNRLIEAHQGRIWIESEEGKGTRCFFTLPTYNNRGVRHGKKDKGQYRSVRRG